MSFSAYSQFTDNLLLHISATLRRPVSYTHLDVYKRQSPFCGYVGRSAAAVAAITAAAAGIITTGTAGTAAAAALTAAYPDQDLSLIHI